LDYSKWNKTVCIP